VFLQPVTYYPDPFRGGDNILVLCECVHPLTMKPIDSNTRAKARTVFEEKAVDDEETWWGIEQEYTLFEADGVTPLGWPQFGYPGPQGPYYCSNGARRAYGRQVMEAHYRACLYAGVNISGTNAEVMAGQWEYQIGPCTGISSGDSVWVSRFIMERICESFQVVVSFHPKPIKGDWNGAGAHTNYSTKTMRNDGGYDAIIKAIEKLGKKHKEHIAVYGQDNDQRLTGAHETASIDTFSYGVADRGASIRIPNQAKKDGKGYFEDRRPASNCDPYVVTSMIAHTTLLWSE
jgi:glutamine synthetase